MSAATPNTQSSPVINLVGIEFDPKPAIQEIAKDWGWIFAAGIVSVLGGIAALLAPVFATGVVGLLIATTLFVVGCVNLTGVFFAEKGLKLDSFLVGTVQVLLAAVMAFYPFESLASLTIFVAAVFLVDGIARIALAWTARELTGWGWSLASGIATVALSGIIIAGLPGASFWVIGTLVGVNMLMNGAARIVAAIEAHKIAKATTA